MKAAFSTVGAALGEVRGEVGVMLAANLLTSLFLLPLIALCAAALAWSGNERALPLVFAVLFAFLPCPLLSGLQSIVHNVLHRRDVWLLRDSWQGIRLHARISLQVWLVSIAVLMVIAGNIAFYSRFSTPVAAVLRILWFYVLLAWIALHLYVYPLIVSDRSLRPLQTYREALRMTLLHPAITLVTAALWILLALLFSATGLVLVIGLAVAATVQQQALSALVFGPLTPHRG